MRYFLARVAISRIKSGIRAMASSEKLFRRSMLHAMPIQNALKIDVRKGANERRLLLDFIRHEIVEFVRL
ncbi:hypothetical protein [Bradyrhizobium guangdongense]|uniref:hypothetical protein n=1 Tax=Bradyrhizobium guangdongense TaxID=1325090 RepID=UPI001009AF0F|nr:hypothetical protein [Bradyrhizobium guangdongense]